MITPFEWGGMIAGSTVLASTVTALATRRPSMIKAFTDSYRELTQRLASVEAKVETLESTLNEERTEHSRTRDVLRVALRHIRDVVAWGAGPRLTELPPPPAELVKELF